MATILKQAGSYNNVQRLLAKKWIEKYRQYAVKLTNAAMSGIDKDGGLWYEYEQKKQTSH